MYVFCQTMKSQCTTDTVQENRCKILNYVDLYLCVSDGADIVTTTVSVCVSVCAR